MGEFRPQRVAGLCAGLLAVTVALLAFSPTFRVRVAEPDVDRWYRAEYTVGPLSQLRPNELTHTRVTVSNRGLVTWRPDGLRPVALAYHWLDARTRLVVRYNGRRTGLPQPLAPGETIALDAAVQAPDRSGAYVLGWDMVAENGGWFSERGNPIAEVAVTVAGTPVLSQPAPAAEPAGLPQRIAPRPAPPARSQLWGVAMRLWLAHPWLGIGPDVFRHVYGPELGLSRWDDRIHTNNLYLELLVGAGILGLAAFVALIVATLGPALRMLARPADSPTALPSRWWWLTLGTTIGLLTYLIHGTLDMFLEYSATYMLLWGLIGALGALGAIDAERYGEANDA